MLPDDVLDLGGRDVLAAADDGVIGATADEEVALVVEVGDVLGGEPAMLVEQGQENSTQSAAV